MRAERPDDLIGRAPLQHRSRYWLTSPDKLAHPDIFEQEISAICDLYRNAAALHAAGTYLVSTDERTGMQADRKSTRLNSSH